MEVWYPGSFKDLTVALQPPTDDAPLESIPLGKAKDLYDGETRRGRISHRENDPNNHDNQINIRVPDIPDPDHPETPNPWQVILTNGGTDAVTFHAWIEQDERGTSRFDDPTEDTYTLGSICCSKNTLTVGAFDTSEMALLAPPYPATAAGPTRPNNVFPSLQKPELSAPGNNIVAARSYGGTTVMSGTSMAAAHVTGLVALLFERARRAGHDPLPIDITRQVLISAAKSASPSSTKDALRLGAGRIDGAGSLYEFLSVASSASPHPGLATSTSNTTPAVVSANSLLHKLIEKLSETESFELRVGNNGIPTDAVLKDLVNKLKNENDYNLSVTPPD